MASKQVGAHLPGKPKATVCEDNEETYTLSGCAPLTCKSVAEANPDGYTLCLGFVGVAFPNSAIFHGR